MTRSAAGAAPARGAAPRLPPSIASRRLYYGWIMLGALALTETVSYGILAYAFPVFLVPMQAELGWSKTAITGAFSLGLLVSGFAALPVGRWLDRHGARELMTGGSCAAALLLVSWAAVETLWAFYVIWFGLGLAMAAVLYEPAFAVVANWFVRLRGRALTILTFVAGFASIVFVPLAAWLVEAFGWRSAIVWLAAILALLTIPPHALLLRRRPADLGLVPDGGPAAPTAGAAPLPPERSVRAERALRSGSFRFLTLGFSLSALTTTAMAVHLIPLLLERGFDPVFAGTALGAVGLMALPGRLVFTPLGGRWPRPLVTAAIFALQSLGVAALLWLPGALGVWLCVALFGTGFGAITPARAALLAEFYGAAEYGRISGSQALFLSIARAAAPVGASLLYAAANGYDAVLWALLALCVAAGGAVLLAGSAATSRTSPATATP